ncbi:MAG: GAF domain-containing protein [Anaerolineae bacterium]
MNNSVEILIVEDSPAQAKHLKRLLERHAYQVSVTHDGKAALAAIHQHRPTLVISDIVMPRMDGFELCRRIKADENFKDIPVVLLTQLSEPGDIIQGLECGADNFMTKPYDERALLSRIQYILANQTLRRAALSEMGLEIFFAGKKHFITSGRMQIMDLLLSTYESAIQKSHELQQANRRLITAEHKLRAINEQLQQEIAERMQAEQALQAAHDELETRVEARTAELKEANDALQVEIVVRRRAEEALEQRVQELVALNRLAQQVSANISLDQVVQAAIEGTVSAANADLALVFLRRGNELLPQGIGPLNSRFTHDETPVHRVGECLCGLAVSQGQPLYSSDIHCDPRCTWNECKEAGLRSFVALPLRSGDGIIGVLGLASEMERDFRGQSTFLETLAGDVAIGLQNAILYEQVRRHAAELEQRVAERTVQLQAANEAIRRRADETSTLYEVGRDLAATLDLEALLPAIAQRVTDTLEADRCAVFLFDERASVLRARAAHGYMAERLSDFSYRPGEEIVGRAYATGEFQYAPDLNRRPELPRRDEIRAVLAVPLMSPTAGPLGVLSVSSLRPEAFTPEQQQLLETMAGQIAGAIESARLYRAAERHATELAALHEVGKEITFTLELDTMLETIADDAVRLVGADKSLILLVDAKREKLVKAVGHGYSRAKLEQHTFEEFEDGISGWVLREKVPTLSADIQTDERNRGKALASAQRTGDSSAAVAPLVIRDEVIGTLTVVNSRRGWAFTPADLNLVTMLAGQAAIAIQNARLFEAAQEADRLKSAFLSTMSHELRTPLNSIIGFTGIMLQGLAGPLNNEQTKQLGMVQSSARHLLDLINDVLDISKIEAGQLELASEPFDMRETIEKVVRAAIPLAEKKGLALIAEVAPEVGQIVSDRRRVEQILINLINNAVKFTEAGEVRVECEVSDGQLVTRVVDTGIGVEPEDTPRLFEPFRQLDGGLTRRHEGTGLGLSICKRLVEMLGGEIWAESEGEGEGSTFAFTLPA